MLAICYHGVMSQILVRNLDPDVVEQLKQRAERNHRSLEAEVRAILENLTVNDERRRRIDEFVRVADTIRARSGPQRTNSVDLVREDRDDPSR